MLPGYDKFENKPLKGYKLSEWNFFVYIKSCQYSMFYNNNSNFNSGRRGHDLQGVPHIQSVHTTTKCVHLVFSRQGVFDTTLHNKVVCL
jgi:hypothetical protein